MNPRGFFSFFLQGPRVDFEQSERALFNKRVRNDETRPATQRFRRVGGGGWFGRIRGVQGVAATRRDAASSGGGGGGGWMKRAGTRSLHAEADQNDGEWRRVDSSFSPHFNPLGG